MKKYSNPKAEIRKFDIECIMTASGNALDTWKTQNNGQVIDVNLEGMSTPTRIVL